MMSQRRVAALLGFLAFSACSQGGNGPSTGGGSGGTGGSAGRDGGRADTSTSTGGNTTGGSSGGAAGTPAGGAAGAAGAGGVAGKDAAGDTAPSMSASECSEPGSGPMPVAGFAKAEPIDTRFPFSTHFVGVFSANPRCVGMTSLGDIDNDGDQDFSSGQRDTGCSGQANPGAPVLWWEYCAPDHWVKHTVGTGYRSAAGGGAGDFDGDGWVDLVGGDSWFKNPGGGVRTAAQWSRYPTGAPGVTEEIRVGDVTGDGKPEVLFVEQSFKPQVRTPAADATQMWSLTATLTTAQQQGGYIGDLDGDGRNDILVGDRSWYRSPGAGVATWPVVAIPAFTAFANNVAGSSPITAIADVDTDGDMDIVLQEHWGEKIAWFENGDGKGTKWIGHMLVGIGGPFAAKSKRLLHGLMAFDFDNDGDIDVLSTENQGQFWIYENMDGKGTFAEHLIAMGGAHEPRVADVDCDGDLDFVGVPWGDLNDGAAGRSETIRAHVYFKNELVERGGTPVFVRPKGEVWTLSPNNGSCKR